MKRGVENRKPKVAIVCVHNSCAANGGGTRKSNHH